jgi:hypothetical protein
MLFGVKNGSPTYQQVIIKVFYKYIDVFMKIFLDDFMVFNNMDTHLEKLKKCFIKCKFFCVNLNLNKCCHDREVRVENEAHESHFMFSRV